MKTRARNWLVVLLVPTLITLWMLPARAQSTSPDVPQPWISYAQLVGRQFQAWLEADDVAANQLHQFLEDRTLKAKAGAPPPAIVIRAWISADGMVARVAFDSLGDTKADEILRQLLTTHPITEPPPPDMRQPLRVRLHLTANADEGASAGCAQTPCVPAS
jgi:hypothetical protein